MVTRHGHAAAVLVPAAWHAQAGGTVTDTITAETAVRGLSDLLDRAQGGEHVAVTHRGKPAAVAVPPEWHAQTIGSAPDDRADTTAQAVADPT